MQLNTMDCSSRSNNIERDSDLGDDLSHDEPSDDDMRDCDSVEGDHVTRAQRLNNSNSSNGGDMSFGGVVSAGAGIRSPDHQSELQMSHHHQFPPNHPLNALGSFMGISSLHGIHNLPHNDFMEKLKMQVRDINVGPLDQDYVAAAFGGKVLPAPMNTAFPLPPTSMAATFGHGAQNMNAQAGNNIANGNTNMQGATNTSTVPSTALTNGVSGGSFSFTSPSAPSTKDVNPASNSSTSSEASNSSQQNNGWSFEEQYKQVRQLYEINDDPKRKEFLDDLFSFMQKRGTPINRLPIMAKSVLDLYELYNLVIARGGLVDVINKKLWQEIIKGLHLPSSITSAAFTLRTQYMKYLYPYECEKKNLSSPAELQAAIDGNRREGRRSSYGQYEAMHNQMQMPPMARQSMPGAMQQMSPLALVTHAAASNQQAQAAAAAAAAHHRLMGPTFAQMPNLVTHEIEQRLREYKKLIQVIQEQAPVPGGGGGGGVPGGNGANMLTSAHQQQQQQHQRQRSQSPEITRDTLNALEMSRVALWQMYHNNTSPPASVNASPQGGVGMGNNAEPQRSEALNLSDSPPNHLTAIKREREREPSPETETCERDDFHHQPPPTKRAVMPPGFPASFYLPHGMAAAAAGTNFHHNTHQHESDDEDDGDHNTTANSSNDDNIERQQLNGHHHHHHQHNHSRNNSGHHDKSDDSAIENSPSTSASAGNGHMSPVSTKKIHLTKPLNNSNEATTKGNVGASTGGEVESLNLLSGLQLQVKRNGTGANGEELVVNLELNGIKYSGLLVANVTAAVAASPAVSATNVTTGNDNQDEQAEQMDTEAVDDDTETSQDATNGAITNPSEATLAKPRKSAASAAGGITNGASKSCLKDTTIAT